MRKPRMLQDGARYHITARANRKEMILDASPMKELFLSVVKRAKLKYSFRIENFCIMGNHFHFILQPARGESLSAIMRWIMSVFAMAYNRIRNITGHVWGSRFFSRIIRGLREFMQVFGYIDNNPVQASQIIDPRDWQYGGLRHDREGCTDILEIRPDPEWCALLFPNHTQLRLR
ncbi:MAG: transposase [Rectinemataceae bacterium]|nr:transposase [Rectinemataceae bacterium]